MIMSGWILPDMNEIQCPSYSNSHCHLEAVKKYLANLKKRDETEYKEIMNEFYRLKARKKVLDLEDFAVIKLGWFKVLNYPIRIVFYSPNSPLEILKCRYNKLGYSTIEMDEKQSIINIHISSQELI